MKTEQLIEELGISPILAVDLLDNLGVSIEEIAYPQVFSKIQYIVDFLNQYPEDTQRFLIKKATINKQDKLKCMFEYSQLLREKEYYEKVANDIEKEKSAVEFSDNFDKTREVAERENENNNKINSLKEEIDLYHK